MVWNIFCRVIDNFGDIGVCWRLSSELAARGERVRLWVDDLSALDFMASDAPRDSIEVRPWKVPLVLSDVDVGDVLIEAFGCTVPDEFVTIFSIAVRDRCTRASGTFHAWINLEYLSAELFARKAHGLPSPVQNGPAAGLFKHFFYPGFTPDSGGLIREHDLLVRQARFDPAGWLAAQGINTSGERRFSLFCYEPSAIGELLVQLAGDATPTRLLVTAGRAQATVRARLGNETRRGALTVSYLPLLSQTDFDHLLWASDMNFVRGEDSLVRALWADKPFVWQIYPQHDGAHAAKLEAFLNWLGAPQSLRRFHRIWNGLESSPLPAPDFPAWHTATVAARERLLAQDDLVARLMQFVGEKQ